MRRTSLMKSFAGFSRGLAVVALTAASLVCISSCEKHSNSDRSESIEVYTDPSDSEPFDVGYLGVRGGIMKCYVKSNVDFVASWEDDTTSPWVKILDYTAVDPASGYRVITMEVQRRHTTLSYYTRRTGMLILSPTNAGLNYNKIIPMHQGSVARISNNFDNFKYGKTDPRFTDGETPIENWTTAQKNYGFTSTVIDGETNAHCYGKNGYLKLGDDKGHGADLISPFTNTLRSDSLLMLSFRAVANTDFFTGEKDDNKIRVEVLNGGVIADFAEEGKTSIDLEAAYYDINSEEFPSDMWVGSDFLVFIASTEHNPITVNTQVRIVCGSLDKGSTTNNRIFLDNFYLRRLTADEEDYFTENNGSGKDMILGAPYEEDVE